MSKRPFPAIHAYSTHSSKDCRQNGVTFSIHHIIKSLHSDSRVAYYHSDKRTAVSISSTWAWLLKIASPHIPYALHQDPHSNKRFTRLFNQQTHQPYSYPAHSIHAVCRSLSNCSLKSFRSQQDNSSPQRTMACTQKGGIAKIESDSSSRNWHCLRSLTGPHYTVLQCNLCSLKLGSRV
jgi:hypothetical protein